MGVHSIRSAAFATPLTIQSRRAKVSSTCLTGNRVSTTQPVMVAPLDKKASRRSLDRLDGPKFDQIVAENAPDKKPLCRRSPSTLQINIGLTCNLACRHCHVESSPSRVESMPRLVAERLVHLTKGNPTIRVVDITGGAPELHEEFRYLVTSFANMGLDVIDRCNLSVLEEPGQEDLVDFLAANRVKVVASLPCYSPENVERQRGDGVFDSSIRAIQKLNSAGYGRKGTGLDMDLVYNPGGASLPPPQLSLEQDYRRELKRAFDIDFSNLICITNMPIKRFADDLLVRGALQDYMDLLVNSFNPATLSSVMCLDMVHVAWDGSFYDCDFNYALDMHIKAGRKYGVNGLRLKPGLTVFDVEGFSELEGLPIMTGRHCFGCTAGTGSSCGGTLS